MQILKDTLRYPTEKENFGPHNDYTWHSNRSSFYADVEKTVHQRSGLLGRIFAENALPFQLMVDGLYDHLINETFNETS